MVKAESFFELSHESRQKIVDILHDSPLRHTDMVKELGIAPAEVTRHLQRLVKAGFIHKNQSSEYEITTLGRVNYYQLRLLVFIDANSEYFGTHDLSVIPKELQSFTMLEDAEFIKGPMRIFETMHRISREANVMLYSILPETIDPLVMEHNEQLKRGLELRLLTAKGGRLPTEYSDNRLMDLQIKDGPEVKVSQVLSENKSVLIFPNYAGDLTMNYAIVGSTEAFLRWNWLIFEHHWMLGKDIIF
jgi:predicted transcriptional regulator